MACGLCLPKFAHQKIRGSQVPPPCLLVEVSCCCSGGNECLSRVLGINRFWGIPLRLFWSGSSINRVWRLPPTPWLLVYMGHVVCYSLYWHTSVHPERSLEHWIEKVKQAEHNPETVPNWRLLGSTCKPCKSNLAQQYDCSKGLQPAFLGLVNEPLTQLDARCFVRSQVTPP